MARMYIREFNSRLEAEIFLQDLIVSRIAFPSGNPMWGLHGKQLVFTTPAKTVTFVDASNAGLTINDIVDQINDQTSGTPGTPPHRKTSRIAQFGSGDDNRLMLCTDSDVMLNLAGGSTAAAMLGLPDGGTVGTNKCLASGGTRTYMDGGTKGANGDTYYVFYQE